MKTLYDVAREICHEHGFPWVDPRTGECHPVPRDVKPPDYGYRHWTCPTCGQHVREKINRN